MSCTLLMNHILSLLLILPVSKAGLPDTSKLVQKWWSIKTTEKASSSSSSSIPEAVHKWWFLSTSDYSGPSQEPVFDSAIADCYLRHKGTKDILRCGPLVDDPNFLNQWYIVPRPETLFGNQRTVDLGILNVWMKYEYFGQNVVVVVNDDGLDTTHPDIKSNYDPNFGWNLCDGQDGSNPNTHGAPTSSRKSHGTQVAGVLAMSMNNGVCGVGVAPQVKLGAANIICGERMLQDSLQMKTKDVHITVNSFSTNRYLEEKLISGIPRLLFNVFERTASVGRGGLGTIHVFSAGNGKADGFSCSFNAYAQSIHTIIAAATTPWGGFTSFSSRCAAVMVAAPTSTVFPQYLFTTTTGHKCDNDFGGTSAVTPMVAGIIALTLNANPKLTWRDVQHLLAYTCSKKEIADNTFYKNAAGFHVSHDFGFGLINAIAMVQTAHLFKTVPTLHICTVPISVQNAHFSSSSPFEESIETDACSKKNMQEVNYLEHVQLYVKMSFTNWCNLHIDLVSPRYTVANLLDREPGNDSKKTELVWMFDSVMTWGESPRGAWTIRMYDETEFNEGRYNSGEIYSLGLTFFGTQQKPSHYS